MRYVAITRARRLSLLTMASVRTDQTRLSGDKDGEASRSRVDYLSQAGIRPEDGWGYEASLWSIMSD